MNLNEAARTLLDEMVEDLRADDWADEPENAHYAMPDATIADLNDDDFADYADNAISGEPDKYGHFTMIELYDAMYAIYEETIED